MANWVSITDADLIDHKVAALVSALKTSALAAGQTDPTPGLRKAVVDRVRRKIASNPRNRVDDDPTKVPAGLKDLTLDLLVFALKNRLELDLTTAEEKRLEIIEKDLTAIARGLEAVEQPDVPVEAPVESAVGMDIVSSTRRQASRNQTAGL